MSKPDLLEAIEIALRKGAPEVIGYDHNGERAKAYREGWNANAERIHAILQLLRDQS